MNRKQKTIQQIRSERLPKNKWVDGEETWLLNSDGNIYNFSLVMYQVKEYFNNSIKPSEELIEKTEGIVRNSMDNSTIPLYSALSYIGVQGDKIDSILQNCAASSEEDFIVWGEYIANTEQTSGLQI